MVLGKVIDNCYYYEGQWKMPHKTIGDARKYKSTNNDVIKEKGIASQNKGIIENDRGQYQAENLPFYS